MASFSPVIFDVSRIDLMPLFDMILSEAGVIRYEFELPRAQLELTSRLATATFLKPAHPGRPKKILVVHKNPKKSRRCW